MKKTNDSLPSIPSDSLTILLNGEQRRIAAGSPVSWLLSALGIASDTTGIAIARNDEVVPRSMWSTTRLGDGDRCEVITAMQGG